MRHKIIIIQVLTTADDGTNKRALLFYGISCFRSHMPCGHCTLDHEVLFQQNTTERVC